ncbi:MAG: rod shape-determining protein MreC [Ginsengibacter sp.]
MRNIFIFIRRYFTFFFFLILEGFCFYMLFKYNRYHSVVFMAEANEVTGKIYKQYNTIEYYFQLKKTNDSLLKANEKLYNKLKQDFELPDNISTIVIDSIKVDSVEKYRKLLYMQAKVVANSVSLPNNYLQLSRGALQGVSKDLGVIDANNNVVGTVIDISNNYSVVMSLLHMQSSISAKLKKTGEEGAVVWDGKQPNIVFLKGISKGVKITRGDSVVTSGFTDRFPYGLLIGTVNEILLDKKTNNYILKIKTAANFYNIQFVYIINNLLKEEPLNLLKRVQATHE